MKLLTALSVLALAFQASALVGSSGIVSPDGAHVQFSHEFAQADKSVGASGIVGANGENIQLTDAQARLHNNLPGPQSFNPAGNAGAGGYFKLDGTPVQLTHEQAFAQRLVGPGGIVFAGAPNVQFRKKRSTIDWSAIGVKDNLGAGGVVYNTGELRQLTPEEADQVLLAGPSGIILKDGSKFQRSKRSVNWGALTTKDNVGASGIVYGSGQLKQFSAIEADQVASAGPSGVVLKDGRLFQFPHRRRRSLGSFTVADLIGASGVVSESGNRQFTADQADEIVLVGPSGVVTKSGKNYQRTKREAGDLVGPGGAVLQGGRHQVQFKKGNAKLILEGPSGYVFDDGSIVQKAHVV